MWDFESGGGLCINTNCQFNSDTLIIHIVPAGGGMCSGGEATYIYRCLILIVAYDALCYCTIGFYVLNLITRRRIALIRIEPSF